MGRPTVYICTKDYPSEQGECIGGTFFIDVPVDAASIPSKGNWL